MKVYKTELRNIKYIEKHVCDWCGNDIKPEHDCYDENTHIYYKKAYNEYGDYWVEEESWLVDLCRDCMGKVKKYLEDNGCKIQDYD